MSDAKTLIEKVIKAVRDDNLEKLKDALAEVWFDGHHHGFQVGYDKAKAEEHHEAEVC